MRESACIAVLICLTLLSFASDKSDKYDLLGINANVSPKRLSRGQEGNIVLNFSVKEGIIISSQPSFIIEIEPSDILAFSKDFFTASDLDIKVKEKDGVEYLDLSEPVKVPFTVKTEAERGNHMVKGKVRYFACSLEEEWCLKDKKGFSATFYTSIRHPDH